MGNTNDTDKAHMTLTPTSTLSKKWKQRIKQIKPKSSDAFFIKHVQNKVKSNITDIESLDQRRYIFVSLHGLFLTWEGIPYITLYSSVFVLPLKKDWLYSLSPSNYAKQLQSIQALNIFSNFSTQELQPFFELLKWKDSQGLIMWALDYENKTYNDLIHPFWHAFNDKLCSLYDPITRKKYKTLQFDNDWWTDPEQFVSKYDKKSSSILSELFFGTLKFDSMSEIIYQSNPDSLCPLKSYTNQSCSQSLLSCDIEIEEISKGCTDEEQQWCMLDYDPNDCDNDGINSN